MRDRVYTFIAGHATGLSAQELIYPHELFIRRRANYSNAAASRLHFQVQALLFIQDIRDARIVENLQHCVANIHKRVADATDFL